MNRDLIPAEQRTGWWILAINTLAFTVCFAAWMMNGVLITFLVDNGVHTWGPAEMGWLIGIPVLSGYLLNAASLWTSCWMFFIVLIAVCFTWMHIVIQRMMRKQAPALSTRIE